MSAFVIVVSTTVALAMYDASSPSSQRVIAQLEKPSVRESLLKIAFWSTKNEAAAEDLVADALVRVMDPDDWPWKDERRTFLFHMTLVMRRVWYERMRKHGSLEVPDGMAFDERCPSKELAADEALDRRRALEVLEAMTLQLLAFAAQRHPCAKEVLELAMEGTVDAGEQAGMLGCSIEEVYEANRFLRRHGQRIRDEQTALEEERMRAVRQAATKRIEEVEP